jgi:hypothetical protein
VANTASSPSPAGCSLVATTASRLEVSAVSDGEEEEEEEGEEEVLAVGESSREARRRLALGRWDMAAA